MRSLGAPLPYPPAARPAHVDASYAARAAAHPANRFAQEFLGAQIASAKRSRYTKAWPLFEFWGDRARAHMRTIDEFIEPLCREALRRKAEKRAEGTGGMDGEREGEKEVSEEETLLEHLVKLTDGAFYSIRACPEEQTDADDVSPADLQIIRDETLNILLAGRDTVRFTHLVRTQTRTLKHRGAVFLLYRPRSR